jgi:hypothetical protein
VRTPSEYQSRVPLSCHEDYRPWLERVARGERDVLTGAPVVALQPSGGTSGGSKAIPYTRALQGELRRAIAPWVFDLHRSRPGLALGASYWSITPALQGRAVGASAVRVGFEEDSEYLGGFWRRLLGATLAVPADVRHVSDAESFRYVTLLFLLRRGDLRLVSVWHPSFCSTLCPGTGTPSSRTWGEPRCDHRPRSPPSSRRASARGFSRIPGGPRRFTAAHRTSPRGSGRSSAS